MNRAIVPAAAALAAAVLGVASSARAQLLPPAPPERCGPAPAGAGSARAWLDRAAAAVLPADPGARVLTFRASLATPLWEQSDRMYEPFIPNVSTTDRWFDARTGIEGRSPAGGSVPPRQRPPQLSSATATYLARDAAVTRVTSPAVNAPPLGESPPVAEFNPWLVLLAWRGDADGVRISGRCLFRDAWRVVLSHGDERLYLSESDAQPVKLERIEPHYLWGQVRAEYVWSTWWNTAGGGKYPLASFRLFDGTVYEQLGVAQFQTMLVARDSAPRLDVAGAADAPPAPTFDASDTVRVDDTTWLLRTRAYTQAAALRRDTVFLFDATTSEARARHDSAWVATLFPGRHPVVLVVTDLAWPHISGVRFWAARGAVIASHRSSEAFLRRVFDRKWTLHPDALEAARATARFRFRAVDDSLRLAGGDVVLHALRNSSTETAIGAWLASDRFFWAGDYVQAGGASPYAADVVATIRALGLSPLKVGAQHVPLTDWATLDARFPQPRP